MARPKRDSYSDDFAAEMDAHGIDYVRAADLIGMRPDTVSRWLRHHAQRDRAGAPKWALDLLRLKIRHDEDA